MKEQNSALYPMSEQLPYKPEELAVTRYILPQTFSEAVAEEAAARLIIICQKVEVWCGVSVNFLLEIIADEVRQEAMLRRLRAHNVEEGKRYRRERAVYNWKVFFSIITLGILALVLRIKRPALPDFKDIPGCELPTSLAYMLGAKAVLEGIAVLKEKGMVRIEERPGIVGSVIFPTAQLLDSVKGFKMN